MRARTILSALIVAALALVAGAISWWYFMATRAETAIAESIRQFEARGYSVSYATLERSGFPTRLELTFTDLVLSWDPEPQGGRIEVPSLTASSPIWNPEEVEFISRTGMTATFAAGGERVTLSASELRGDLQVEPGQQEGRQWRAASELSAVRARTGRSDAPVFTAEKAVLNLGVPEVLLLSGDAVADVRIDSRLTDVVFAAETPLGNRIDEALISSDVTAPLPGSWSEQALAAWRDRGGRVILHRGALDWGHLAIEGAGTLGLDEALRPEGEVEVRARGYEMALDELAREGVLSRDQLPALKLALAFISRQPTPDSPREAGAKLDLEDGRLSLGPFRLVRLPSVVPRAGF